MPDTPTPSRALTPTERVRRWRQSHTVRSLNVDDATHKIVRIYAAASGKPRMLAAHELIVAGHHALTDYAAIEALKDYTDEQAALLSKDTP